MSRTRIDSLVIMTMASARRRRRVTPSTIPTTKFKVNFNAESRTPLDELLVPIKVLAVVAVVGRLELDLVVVFFGGLVGLPFARESFDDAFGLRGFRRVGVGVDEVDDLRASRRGGMSLM